jgi:hypothetical protein
MFVKQNLRAYCSRRKLVLDSILQAKPVVPCHLSLCRPTPEVVDFVFQRSRIITHMPPRRHAYPRTPLPP